MSSIMIHQPEYLPWVNLFFKMVLSDTFVFLDTVQYVRRSFQNRNRIKTRLGPRWLTVPLQYAPRNQIIKEMEIDNLQTWREQHLRLIKDSYKSALYYDETLSLLEPIYAQEWNNLSELNCTLIMEIGQGLGISRRFIKSSELPWAGNNSELILDICLKLNASRYISGIGAKSYLDQERFRENNIDIVYVPPLRMEYPQRYPENGFVPDLSIVDYLFNNGTTSFKSHTKNIRRDHGGKSISCHPSSG